MIVFKFLPSKSTCVWGYFDAISIAADSKPHIFSILLPRPSAISPLSLPAVGETCPSTSSWQSSKHFPVSCVMMFNRAVDTYHSLPVTPLKAPFEGSFYILWGKLEM